jgi:photosystem II stability/assembly factor-like uncharacterized protein
VFQRSDRGFFVCRSFADVLRNPITCCCGQNLVQHRSGGGSISTIAIDPQNSSVLYVGTAGGGVIKSTDGGASWADTGANFGSPILVMAVDPQNSSIVYAGTQSDWLYRTTDGGGTWNQSNFWGVRSLAIDPQNPANIYVGRYDSVVYRSADHGATWAMVQSGLVQNSSQSIRALAIDPISPWNVYAGFYGGGVVKLLSVPGWDVEADGKADISVWRPDSGVWYVIPSLYPGSYAGT